MKLKKKLLAVSMVIALASAGVVVADYFGLFGTTKVETTKYVKAGFYTVDGDSGARIADVKVRCVQKHVANACAQRKSGRRGLVSIVLRAKVTVTRSYLFIKSEDFIAPPATALQIMFAHPDYENRFASFQIMALLTGTDEKRVVKLTKSKE